jgi:hypothetical protein
MPLGSYRPPYTRSIYNMAEPFGIAAGAVGIAAAFTACVNCFGYVQLGRHFGRDLQTDMLALNCSRLCLTRWGQAVNIYDDPKLGRQDATPAEIQAAKDTLHHILRLFADTEKISKKYKLNANAGDDLRNSSKPNYSTPSCSTPSCSTPSCSTPSCSTPSCSTPSCSTPNCRTPSCSVPKAITSAVSLLQSRENTTMLSKLEYKMHTTGSTRHTTMSTRHTTRSICYGNAVKSTEPTIKSSNISRRELRGLKKVKKS